MELNYISPSSYASWVQDPEQWYLHYGVGLRTPQTAAMAVGSAFDAFVKAYISERLHGRRVEFEFSSLFESQVSEPHRDAALEAGRICFYYYRKYGCLGRLMELIDGKLVRMETQITGTVGGQYVGLGRPDLIFELGTGRYGIVDWKVNGYYSNASPEPGYYVLEPGSTRHKRYSECVLHGIPCNDNPLRWEDQLLQYHWILGSPIDEPCLGMIEQLVFRGGNCRVASFRNKLLKPSLFDDIVRMWNYVKDGWYLHTMSKEESIERCKLLDMRSSDSLYI